MLGTAVGPGLWAEPVPALQEEYLREQIEWKEIPFSDNQPCIDLISQKPYGILRILDDQSCFPQVRGCPVMGAANTEGSLWLGNHHGPGLLFSWAVLGNSPGSSRLDKPKEP